jgi:hypothetical protein
VPTDYADLVGDLRTRLDQAAADRPIVVFIDSLDQLSLAGAARSLSWVPMPMPQYARLVLSTRPGDTLTPLQNRAGFLEVAGLPRTDGEALLARWLDHAGRTLTSAQRSHLLDSFERSGCNPLYLQLAFEEARRWTSGDGAPPTRLAQGLDALIRDNLFHRLQREEQHGEVLVSHALGYLAASRYGLAEDELVDLLSRDVDVYAWFLTHAYHVPPDLRDLAGPERIDALRRDETKRDELNSFLTGLLGRADGPRLPAVVWSRLLADLAPYLAPRHGEGGDLLAFNHRELDAAAEGAFAAAEAGQLLHGRLADYFRAKADPDHDGSWTVTPGHVDLRGLAELPYHLTRAGRWDELESTLTDFTFLEQKAAHVGVAVRGEGESRETVYTGVFHLQDDFDDALEHLTGGEGKPAHRPLIVTAVDLGHGLQLRCPWCNTVHAYLEEWHDEQIACPNPECGMPLKVNPFVVERRGR